MPNLDFTSILLLSSTAAGIAVIYYSFLIVREWFRKRHPGGKGIFRMKCQGHQSMHTLSPNGLKAASGWTPF